MPAFYYQDIDENKRRIMQGKSYPENCPIPISDLCCIHVLHYTYRGEIMAGEMICNIRIAETLLEIFKDLYIVKYPIERMIPIDYYEANDELSMADNNSSCFNYRTISFSNIISKHGLGLAVDINPLYNPYIKMVNGRLNIEPANGLNYVDRKKDFPYKIIEGDFCHKLFIDHGFIWGGKWTETKDYQHFELPDEIINAWYPSLDHKISYS